MIPVKGRYVKQTDNPKKGRSAGRACPASVINMKNAAPITNELTQSFAEGYAQNAHYRAMANALTRNGISGIACRHDSLRDTNYKFSLDIKTLPAADQKSTGRCWLFAGLNVLREIVAKKHNLEKFELSQNYVAFWDKYEKVNYFLESVIDLIDRPVDDRHLTWVLSTGIQDGGQWDMFVNIVKKYGIVPKDAMAETHQSSNTGQMNGLLNIKLRQYAARLQAMFREGAAPAALQAEKAGMLKEAYAFLRMNFGAPPESFDFEYVDKDKKYGVQRGYTPLSFCKEYIGESLDEYVSVINAPTKDKPYGKTFTVDYIGNVVGGSEILYLNLEMRELIDLAVRQLKDGEVVWFGSDVGMYGDRDSGVWNDEGYDYDTAFSMDFSLSKELMLDYRQSSMNHAMVITGVNFGADGNPNRWKIENSWGDKKGDEGYYLMSASWFEKFVYQAVVNKKYLSAAQLDALSGAPIRLNPWDPMGTLAE